MNQETIAVVAGLIGLSQILAVVLGRLVDRIGRGSASVFSESDKAFLEHVAFTMRQEFEQHRGLLHAQRERTDRTNDHLSRILDLVDQIERTHGRREPK